MSKLDKLKEIEIPQHGFQYSEFKDSGGVVISPSGLRNLIESPSSWKTNVIDGVKTFSGNSNTEIGGYVHYYSELYYENKLTSDFKMPRANRDAYMSKCSNLDLLSYIDKKKTIRMDAYLDSLCRVLHEEYLDMYPHPEEVEGYVEYKFDDKTMIAGSFDMLEHHPVTLDWTVVDIKTTNKKLNEKSMLGYILQLSIYCRLLELTKDIKPTKVRIVAVVKNQKPSIQILEAEPNYELVSKIVSNAYNAIRFERKEELTYDELSDLIFNQNIYSFTMEDEDIAKIIGKVEITTSEETKVKQTIKNVFG